MDEVGGAQLHHDSAVHAALLMDLLRIVRQLDPVAFQHCVEQAERELHNASAEQNGSLPTHSVRSVLDHRLAYLRSVQIQATVGPRSDLGGEEPPGAYS